MERNLNTVKLPNLVRTWNSIRFEKFGSNPIDFKAKKALLFEFGADILPNFPY